MKCTNCGKEGIGTLCAECSQENDKTDQNSMRVSPEKNIASYDNQAVEQHESSSANKCRGPNNGDQYNSHSDDSEEYITCDSGDDSEGSVYEADQKNMQSTLIYSRQTSDNEQHTVKDHTTDITNSGSPKLQQKKTIAMHSTKSESESQNDIPVPNIQNIDNSNITQRTTETKYQTYADTLPIVPAVGIPFGPVVTKGMTKISETLVVRFHVYLSIELMSKPEDRFYIRFGNENLDGWNSLKHEMKKVCHEKKYEGKCFEYEYSIPIQRRLLKNGIDYKYVVVNSKSKKEHWENYKSRHPNHNRLLRASGLFETSNGFWHQYDGIVLPESGLFQKALSFFASDNKHLALGYLNDLTPELFTRPISEANRSSIKGDIDHCIMLFDGVLRVYVTDMEYWKSTDEFHSEVTKPKLAAVIDLISSKPSNQRSENRVLQALSAVVICQCFGIVLKMETWERLCECLLLSLDADNQQVVEIESICTHFREVNIPKALVYIVNCFIKYSNSDKPSWLFCLPLLHITSAICTPFNEPNRNLDIQSEKWWGTDHVREVAYKTSLRKCNHEDVIRKLKPLYKMDCYLSRSIARTLSTQDNNVFISDLLSLETVCAILLQRTREKIKMDEAFENVTIRLQSKLDDNESSEEQCWLAYKITFELFVQHEWKLNLNSMLTCVHVFLHCVARYDRRLKDRTSHTNVNSGKPAECEHLEYLNKIADKCLTRLCTITHMPLLDRLKAWNLAFPETLPSEIVLEKWIAKASNIFETHFYSRVTMSQTNREAFLEHYCSGNGSYSQPMHTCLSTVAFKVIESGNLNINASRMTQSGIPKYADLMSKLFLKQWGPFSSTTDVYAVLEQALTWVPMKQFIEHHHTHTADPEKMCLLTKQTASQLSDICCVLQDFGQSIIDGTVTVDLLDLISRHENQFCNIYVCLNDVNMALQIECRKKELHAFKQQAGLMQEFVNKCQHDQVEQIRDILNRTIWNQKMCDLCDTNKCQNVTFAGVYVPQVLAFAAFPSVVDILEEFSERQNSYLFKAFWDQRRTYLNTSGLSIDEIIDQVWLPVDELWQSFGRKIESRTMLFETFQQNLGKVFENDDERLEQEVMAFGLHQAVAFECVQNYNDLRNIESSIANASLFLEIKQHLNLRGDFFNLEEISNFSERKFELDKVDEHVMQSCATLMSITVEERDCLKAFMKCKPLITWLQQSMAGEELKVFIDLAMMSAGDEPINIGKVQCLHSAVTGYSPLIFELDANSSYTQLLDKCKTVWKELQTNPELPNQIIDTNSQLAWLEEIKKAHGSVEVTSLKQAEAINNDGMYIVGIDAEGGYQGEKMTEHDILRLVVPEKDGERQYRRTYSLADVQDLHSRIMLVSGKNSQDTQEKEVDVDMFTLIFDSVTRVGLLYRQLCESGCVLFYNFKAEFMCNDTDRPVCVNLEFIDRDAVLPLKGRRSTTNEGLKEMIPEIAKCMETFLKEWLQYIKTKREEYNHLNYFTIGQLIILQRELVKDEGYISNAVFPLLSAIKQNCSPDDLKSAMTKAQTEVVAKSQKHASDATSTSTNNQETLSDTETRFLCELKTAKIDETLARRYIQHVRKSKVQSFNVQTARQWCMVERAKERSAPVKEETVQEKPNTWGSLSNYLTVSFGSPINVGSAPLISDLQQCWKSFLGSVSAPNSDYLSLEHLGIILRHLAEEDCYERVLPENFIKGQPYLIMCKKEELMLMTLSIYMLDEAQPLPRSDEILLCTDQTSFDEVEIFLRRAMVIGGGKIHCLVNADVLGYETSALAIQLIKDNIQSSKKKGQYRLFVICESSNENRSSFGIALHKYLQRMQPPDSEKLKSYVFKHLTVPNSRMHSAAVVELNRSSVRLVKSNRAGVGKSLYVKRVGERLVTKANELKLETNLVSIPLQEKRINIDEVVKVLKKHTPLPGVKYPRLFHIDISTEVEDGLDFFLFNLLILKCVVNTQGYVWRRDDDDLYLIEAMPMLKKSNSNSRMDYKHPVFSILPNVICKSPQECLIECEGHRNSDKKEDLPEQRFDETNFKSVEFQRAYEYLCKLDQTQKVVYSTEFADPPTRCLNVLLGRCGIVNPSWSEIQHFVSFLNTQLVDYEQNQFVSCAAEEDLPGFSIFVLRFLIQMSKDFATRSLNISEDNSDNMESSPNVEQQSNGDDISEENPKSGSTVNDDTVLSRFEFRRTWETSPHPYILFNFDRGSFTFLGFNIENSTGDMIDVQTNEVLEKSIMQKPLIDGLTRNKVPLRENADVLHRTEKLKKLCTVMGVEKIHDPDPTYELTMDNIKKILAIYMRFRCGIPVIVMGETGCGKTRLVKFMCDLQCPPGSRTKNMILVKVHGGTTKRHIKKTVQRAEEIANQNVNEHGKQMYTVLFFDEANTTEASGIFKEIMCDKSICGKQIEMYTNLKIIAACNPYRKHPDNFIEQLEQAGLGYHVDASETTDTLGKVPMRRLVYRVQPLPQSLLPLVWDFGQLNTEVEKLYILQIVKQCKMVIENDRRYRGGLTESLSDILATAQQYMRDRKDECSFVSLRDIERVLLVMTWFYKISEHLYPLIDLKQMRQEKNVLTATTYNAKVDQLDKLTRSLILALGVCYHACLKERGAFRTSIAAALKSPFQLPGGAERILQEIENCQDVFLDNVLLNKNIAKNTALRENVFMMVVCIELRIPLFLVGKPGSSKSLAKTIVADAMQGKNSRGGDLFKHFKQVQMVSFQCSPLATSEGIIGTFRQCAQFQKDKDLHKFVSVVVLDEIGLAEDSPRMPLKTLHPLLEDGCVGEETPEKYKKVAFIGISNWALDPAKMNRGILVQREVPDLEELKNSARGICYSTDELYRLFIEQWIEPLAIGYIDVFNLASEKREFFGLRDFYSLVKMVNRFVTEQKRQLSRYQIIHAIKRNFGGLDSLNPEQIFMKHLGQEFGEPTSDDPDCSAKGLIEACLSGNGTSETENRYLLLLTENYGSLPMIRQKFFKDQDKRPIIIFGSHFRSDREYTQVCRNINKIKVCMGTGKTVILLNLENLYESLYDALNQYYVTFGNKRYVDLGLGTHRVKCHVHQNFRLIVVAEKQTVYKRFPIPLINRLEKHIITGNTMLDEEHLALAKILQCWAKQLSQSKEADVIIGFHDDACSASVMHVTDQLQDRASAGKILEKEKELLLWCVTPDSLWRDNGLDQQEMDALRKVYFHQQAHESLISYLRKMIETDGVQQLFVQITCHSKLLPDNYGFEITNKLSSIRHVEIVSLCAFDTEQQFCTRIRHFLDSDSAPRLLIVQCDSGDYNANLVACAENCVLDEFEKKMEWLREAPVHVAFVVQLPRKIGGCFTGFQCGIWRCVHIDDVYEEEPGFPKLTDMFGKTIGNLLLSGDHGDMPETASSEGTIRLDGLIVEAVPSALSLIHERHADVQRATQRLCVIHKCLQRSETNYDLFTRGILKIVGEIITEKEEKIESYLAQKWISRVAVSNENIFQNGTFRQACYHSIISKISPVLAYVIAFLDTNNNLDLALSDEPWKRDFWLRCITDKKIVNLKYDGLLSPKDNKELREMVVPNVGCEGHAFQLLFPFSWLITQMTEELFQNSAHDFSNDRINLNAQLLMDGKFGAVLATLDKEENQLDIINDYIHDFVHMVYNPKGGETERNLVTNIIQSGAERLYGQNIPTNDVPGLIRHIVCVRFAFEAESYRLKCFRNINEVWPECSIQISKIQAKSPDFLLCDQQLLGTIGLLASYLAPPFLTNKNQTRTQWLGQVYRSRYIVEHVFSVCQAGHDVPIDKYSQARAGWSRILMLKLFIENLFPDDREDILTNEECSDLWNIFDADVNMKDLKSFESLEGFLETCNIIAVTKTIAFGATCSRCETLITIPPTVLPCAQKHVICKTCYMEIKTNLNKCPRCKQAFQVDWEQLETNKKEIARLEVFQKQCNTFFLDVVTQLCFSEDIPPSKEVLSKLFGHVTCTGISGTTYIKNLSLFDTGLDPNPVFRSFLLQLIFKFSDIKCVTEYIKQFIQNSQSSNEENNLMGIYFLIVQCYEDFRRGHLGKDDDSDYNEVCKRITDAQEQFQKTEHPLEIEDVTKLLFCIGDVRVCLGIVGEYMANLFSKNVDVNLGKSSIIIQKARNLCEKNDWPRVFLAKQLCRGYGIEVYRGICNSSSGDLKWLAYNSAGDLVADSDRYIVCGTNYTNVRQAVSKCLQQSTEIKNLEILLENMKTKDSNYPIYVQLAIHRLVTCANAINATTDSEEKLNLHQFFADTSLIEDKVVMLGLLKNNLQPNCLKIDSRKDAVYFGLQCLLTHFKFVLLACPHPNSLMKPFVALMNGDACIENMFLPAMPDRNSDEILDAAGFAEMVYECPNGHKYLIGDCGRPYSMGKCNECGAEIGGKGHVAHKANKLDNSALGHTLGEATEKGTISDIRNLNSTYGTVVRFLVHMAMYLGPVEKVQAVIRSELDTNHVATFLLNHMYKNIKDLYQLIGLGADDVFLLMHHLLHHVALKIGPVGIRSSYANVETKQYRGLWESEFSQQVLKDVLSNLTVLTHLNQRLATDNRPGDPLMSRIYETEGSEVLNPDNLLEDSRMWMYRTPTTIEHMLQKLESVCSNVKRYPVLQLLMKKDKILQALRYVPNILNLVRTLLNRYLKKIDKVEALNVNIKTIKTENSVPEIHNWITAFEKAWEITRPSLNMHVCRTGNGIADFPKEFCSKSITDETPLAVLLPSTVGPGLCSYAMLDFLFREQNAFLDDYIRMAGIKDIKHPSVKPMAVTSTHLISYDHDHDLLPLVLANCRYSFEVGTQTNIEYDFDGMERQLMDRLLNSKSKIEIQQYLKMDLMVYRTEMSNSSVFKRLNEIIKQEPLNFTLRNQIIEEFHHVRDACTSIDKLDIAISFLQTIGGDPNMPLTTFMENTIQMKNAVHGQKVQQFCQLKHAKALWLLLSFQRSKLLVDYLGDIQDVFTTLRTTHFEQILAESQVAFTEYLNSMSCERLFNIMEVLHEFLLLRVSNPENPEDADFVPTESTGLFVGLMAYNEELETTDLDSFLLESAPANILYKHSAEAWKMIYNAFKKKKGEIRH
ncbi:E3 ubiquitin-protein ligase rnf213-alpha-like isoform X2 [Dreissena polymorpha]|uniref:E3 ubiquitin-protein ligase rnf213-alpha-like isoform X2 n=1 Tax=Dreissena polymorpha TaxID=45954 RepID=UPI002265228C|nr:E3 ubiquitin-protein ligase rnf213-alpha-like isoform X2 [Dreissena polymorpha]XP_052215092.1 E3 ubiquitin-protein ligase rnf213-alpha-like isoform X2 [Dreissena polymorpha]